MIMIIMTKFSPLFAILLSFCLSLTLRLVELDARLVNLVMVMMMVMMVMVVMVIMVVVKKIQIQGVTFPNSLAQVWHLTVTAPERVPAPGASSDES